MKTCVCLGRVAAVAVLMLWAAGLGAQESAPHHAYARVIVGKDLPGPVSGRLLVFAKSASVDAGKKDEHQAGGKKEVDINEFHPSDTAVAAVEIHDVTPGSAVEVDLDRVAFPRPFAAMPRADYELQAVLDTDHNYNYSGRDADDWQAEAGSPASAANLS
jgi:hypothetical protein